MSGSSSAAAGGGVRLSSLAMRVVSVAWLTLVWVSLWGDPSLGTALAGLAVGAVVHLAVSRAGTVGAVRVRPLRALLLGVVFLGMLAQSTAAVVRRVLGPKLSLESVVVEVALPPAPPGVATLVANAVTLTPGTLSLDLVVAEDRSAVLLVHALDAPDPEAVRQDTLRLHRLALDAFDRPASPAQVPDAGRSTS